MLEFFLQGTVNTSCSASVMSQCHITFAFLSHTVCYLMLVFQLAKLNGSTVSDHYKQFILNTFHNSPFIPATVGKITALASVTLEQGL